MPISVFTPSHNPRYLDDCYRSLTAQTFADWEWCVLLNGGAEWDPPDDPRVAVRTETTHGVGAAKAAAVKMCRGDVLVELDHDDLLAPDALQHIADTFETHPDASLVYSDFRQILEDGSADPSRFDPAHGWRYDDDGTCHAMAATPHNVNYIWYAPNHVRAFRRTMYDQAGGYNPDMTVLDDQDLMSRLYLLGDFAHIPHTLYLQRTWENTQRNPDINARIQQDTVRLYDERISDCAAVWAARNGLLAVDLGAAHGKPDGWVGIDQHPGPGVDLPGDIFDVLGTLPDNSVGVVRAVDFLEHVADKVRLFNELYRVLAHGGMLLSLTPSTDGRGAWQDPTHVAFYNENSFWYFTDASFSRYVPAVRCRFQVSRLVTYFPSSWHEQHLIPYVCANLIAVKDGPRQGGILNI